MKGINFEIRNADGVVVDHHYMLIPDDKHPVEMEAEAKDRYVKSNPFCCDPDRVSVGGSEPTIDYSSVVITEW